MTYARSYVIPSTAITDNYKFTELKQNRTLYAHKTHNPYSVMRNIKFKK